MSEAERQRQGWREQELPLQERDEKRECRLEETGDTLEICLPQWKERVGSGQGLSLKGTGFPGDSPGQQIIIQVNTGARP